MNNYLAKLMIWDTAGQEKFKSMIKMYYKNAHAAIVVFDVTNIQSFDKAQSWVDELIENTNSNTVIALCGNKVDLEENRKVSYDEGCQFAEKIGAFYIEVSAKNNLNIEKLFDEILNKIPYVKDKSESKGSIDPSAKSQPNKCSYC